MPLWARGFAALYVLKNLTEQNLTNYAAQE